MFPNPDDVVSFQNALTIAGDSRICKIQSLRDGLKKRLNGDEIKLARDEGLDCEYLSADGGGWKRGKLVLRLEFVPEPGDEQHQQ